MRKTVFITGGTGYIGKRLIGRLLDSKHRVISLVRKGSEHKVPPGAETVIADPFDPESFRTLIPAGSVFVQLLGVPHPSPKKARLFREIDLKSAQASADAAEAAAVSRFVYVSVAMSPSKLMRAYQHARLRGEEYCLGKNLACTFLRPWYVLGPGHWWPIVLLPLYGLAELFPGWRKQARAKSLVTIQQMINTLVNAVENTASETVVYEIADIRKGTATKVSGLRTGSQKASYL